MRSVLRYFQATFSPRRWKVNLCARPPAVDFYFSRLCSALLPRRSRGPTGPRYSGWIWNESGLFFVFGREKLWDLVLLEKKRQTLRRAGPGRSKLLAVSSILIWGKLEPPGLCFVMQHVLCIDIWIKVEETGVKNWSLRLSWTFHSWVIWCEPRWTMP